MSRIRLYTVHAYKGMEDDNLRLAEDIDILEDENIYYVAITRGKKKIMMDGSLSINGPTISTTTFSSMTKKRWYPGME